MHEMALAASILEITCRHAAGRRVTRVQVRVGHLRQVVPSSLAFSFELVAQGTIAEGAPLEVTAVPAVGMCRACDARSEFYAFPLQCSSCGGFDLDIVEGEELMVEALDLEEAGSGSRDD